MKLSTVVLALSLMLAGLSGCMSERGSLGSAELPAIVGPFHHPLSSPLLINETSAGQGVQVDVVIHGDCRFDPKPEIQYKLFDRTGLVQAEIISVPDRASFSFEVMPIGSPPWLFVAQSYPCHDGWQSKVRYKGEGYQIDASHGYTDVVERQVDNVTLSLGPGGTRGTTIWNGGIFAWKTIFASPTIIQGRGTFAGTIEMHYPDETPWRRDIYSPVAGHQQQFEPIQYFTGDYPIIVNASQPVVEETTIVYAVDVLRLMPPVCDLGFEWPDLCS